MESKQTAIIQALKTVYDPEISVDIYELGLIYNIVVNEDLSVNITMTLTTPGCPVAVEMPGMVERAVMSVEGITACQVELVWEPAWDISRVSDLARLELGLL